MNNEERWDQTAMLRIALALRQSMGMPNLSDKRKQHPSDGGEDQSEAAALFYGTLMDIAAVVRGAIKVAIRWNVVKGHGCRRGILVFLHRMHGDVSAGISTRCSLAIIVTSAETCVAPSRKVEMKENETERN